MNIQQHIEAGERQLTITAAASALRQGSAILLGDGAAEPVLCLAAQFAGAQTLSQLSQAAGSRPGLVLSRERLAVLGLSAMDARDEPDNELAARVIATLLQAPPLPLRPSRLALVAQQLTLWEAHPGGTLAHAGYAEAALDLLRTAGLQEGAVFYQLGVTHNEEISAALLDKLAQFLQLGFITVDAVARYRQEHRVSFITETHLPTSLATFQLRHYQEVATGLPYLALLLGDMHQEGNVPLLRLHSACATGDIFGSQRCDCQAQLHAAMVEIAREGRGVLLYLPQEGRGIGLGGKLQAYALQEQGFDTIEANELLGYPADARDYSTALEILRDLGLQRVRLLTNNPDKLQALQAGGIQAKRVPLEITPGASNLDYLQTKQRRFGHMLDQSLALYREADKARSYGKSHHA